MMHQPTNQLMELLSQPQISVPELFQKPDILSKIKTKLQLFVDFLLRNSQFTKQMIGIGIKAPMHKNQNMKKVAYVASDILTCDQDIIADLFIQSSRQRIRLYSEDEEFICEEIVTDGQTGELVIADKKSTQDAQSSDPFTFKYLYLLDVLDYLSQTERDENCVNYLSKVLNTVIRVKPTEMFQFFKEKPQFLDLIIKQSGQYPSLAFTLVKLVHEGEDMQYRQEKTQIFRKLIGNIKQSIQNCEAICSYMEFVQQIFNKNKYRGEEIDEIKIVSQPLVDKDIVDWMMETLCKGHAQKKVNIVANCTLYLLKLIERLNVDDEQDPYSYTQVQNQTPTMDFQVAIIFNTFQKLVQMTSQLTRQAYIKTAVLDFLDLLLAIMKNKKFTQVKWDRKKCLQTLLKVYIRQSSNSSGIIKNRLISLIQKILALCSAQKIEKQKGVVELQQKAVRVQENAENKCFNEKLSIVFLHDKSNVNAVMRQIYEKYRSILGPPDFIQKRDRNIEQLKFAHHNPFLETESEIQQENKPPSMILEELNLSYDGSGFTNSKDSNQNYEANNKSPDTNKKGKLNVDLIEQRMRKAKEKKSKQDIKKKEDIVEDQVKKEIYKEGVQVKCGPLKKEQVDYFTKHLILF